MRYGRLFLLPLLLLTLLEGSWAEDVWVTGRPARAEFLKDVLSRRGWNHYPTKDLRPGESWKAPDGNLVINLDWTPPAAAVAALSDHPEDVDRRGLLFSGGLTPHRTVRFQYYHLGSLRGSDPGLGLFVSNHGTETARLYLRSAAGRPSLDYFSTGHTNNVLWLEAEKFGEGEFLDIPAGQTRIIFRQDMPEEMVVSGTLGLSQTEGPPLQFGLLASPDPDDLPALNNLLKETDVHSRGFYPVATQRVERSYVVGQQKESRIAVGALRQETFSGVRELRGDYGVVYDLDLELVNPTEKPVKIELLFNPRGGAATGSFLLDEKIVEVPRTEAMTEAPVAVWELPGGTRRKVRVRTLPEGASSYPVRIILRDDAVKDRL